MSAQSSATLERFGSRSASSASARLEHAGRLLAEVGLPFILVVYLALRGGGYDDVVYGEVGVAVWWVVLLGALIGVFPRARVAPAAWLCLGLLAAFTCWTAVGISWSASAEQSTAELARVATYLGVFGLAVATQRPGSLTRTVNAVGVAIASIGLLALLQRFHPSWFPANGAAHLIPASRARLNYPLNYWNGLAALLAVGVPLLLASAERSRTLLGRGLAAGVLPAVVLAGYFTLSRGGAVELAVALAVLFALYPRRGALLASLAASATGAAILVIAAAQRDDLANGLTTQAAHSQANEMLAMTIVVCAGAGLVQVALALAARNQLGPRPSVSTYAVRRTALVVVVAALLAAVAGGLPGYLSDRWDDFKNPVGSANATAARFDSASGNGRYQYWSAALDANATRPLTGIGPGTYQYWWDQHGSLPGTVRDAHSLYLQTLAEDGIVGFVLIVGLVGGILLLSARQARRAGPGAAGAAAATAGAAAFAAAAAIDWVWQLAVLPAAFFLLAAALLAGREPSRAPGAGGMRAGPRTGTVLASAAALVVIFLPLARATGVQDSQNQVDANDLPAALQSADDAHGFQPYAASPSLQRALVLELQGDFPAAVDAARDATRAESTNWRTWVVLSRVEAEAGNAPASVAAYKRARALDPRSPIFSR